MLPDPTVQPLLTVDELATLAVIPGKRRSALHEAIRAGHLPSVWIGGRVYVPTAELRKLLGIDPDPKGDAADLAKLGAYFDRLHPGWREEIQADARARGYEVTDD